MGTKSLPIEFSHRFSIIGAGKVAKSLADKLQELALLDFILYQNTTRIKELVEFGINPSLITNDYNKITKSDIIIIAVTDKAIEEVVEKILNNIDSGSKTKIVFHTSGLVSAKILNPLVDKGINAFSAHPIQTFFCPNKSLLANISWGIEALNTDEALINSIIKIFDGKPMYLPENLLENRVLYHLLCVVSSNFVTTTIEFAKLIAKYLNIEDNSFLSELIKTTADNCIRNLNTIDAPLTGPLARKDFVAIKKYLDKISGNEPLINILKFYLMANIDLMKEKEIYNSSEKLEINNILIKY